MSVRSSEPGGRAAVALARAMGDSALCGGRPVQRVLICGRVSLSTVSNVLKRTGLSAPWPRARARLAQTRHRAEAMGFVFQAFQS